VLPGKKYSPEDIVRLAWRRKWVIVLPFLVVSAGTAIVARSLPNVYRSETLIAVVPQRVPESYVKATVTTKIEDRLAAINQKVLSRTVLERVIQEFNLYPEERRAGMMEEVVARMLSDVKIDIMKSDAFRVTYESQNARTAMQVCERLAGIYQTESLSDRTAQAQQTATFLESQLLTARRSLEDHERKLAEYKNRHSGELPNELQGNLQVLNNLQLQLQALAQAMNQEQNRRYQAEKTVNELSDPQQVTPTVTISSDDPTAVAGGSTAAQLEAAKAQLQILRLRYKETYPDVLRMQKTIRDLEAKLQAEALQRPLSPGATDRPASPEEARRQERLKAAQTELEMVDRQIATLKQEEKRIRTLMAGYQSRVEATAGRESELTGLMRDYDTLRKNYDELKLKQENAKMAAALEERSVGEQFWTIDAPRVPERPVRPNRPMILLLGALVGLGIGIGLSAILEYQDNSFHHDDDVVRVLALPVMAVIPRMLSAADRQRLRRRALFIGSASVLGAVIAIAAGVFFFLRYGL
jgi:polysaccharide chain length determinant protein (PEP-CTERM system associated)